MTENTAAAKSAAKSALRTCRCGCEAPLGGKASYRPGHDARHVSNLKHKLDLASASGDRSVEAGERIQQEVYAIFAELKTEALRRKLGRAVDNDKEGLYNAFGDAGVFVPYSENPSLGYVVTEMAFEAAHPAEAPKGKKAPKAPKAEAPVVGTEQDRLDTIARIKGDEVEPMWTETAEGDHDGVTNPDHPVKVGRWVYPGRVRNGKIERNTKRDGSGEWIEH